jgi:pyruvate dehydrogenase kinase 2/3/4
VRPRDSRRSSSLNTCGLWVHRLRYLCARLASLSITAANGLPHSLHNLPTHLYLKGGSLNPTSHRLHEGYLVTLEPQKSIHADVIAGLCACGFGEMLQAAGRGGHIFLKRWDTFAFSSRCGISTQSGSTPPWRPVSALDDWVERPIRPISLRQLFFFGRTLTEQRLISSANYVRTELPTRLAHRLHEMQKLPYVVVTNPHLSLVYELYCKAFESFRKVPEIKTVSQNDDYCKVISENLKEHLAVIPNLVMGVLECQDLVPPEVMDDFVNAMLRARISRRVIAEQHLALTETFNSPWHVPQPSSESDFVGEVLLRCNAREVIQQCGVFAQSLGGSSRSVPRINIQGHLNATFPYVLSHLEYIISELLRNSVQAVMDRHGSSSTEPPPIEVLVCEAPQHVVIRISDQGGGVPREILPFLWSFNKGPRSAARLRNLEKVPSLAATMQELHPKNGRSQAKSLPGESRDSSLSTLSSRPPDLRLGMGLPMSRIYAEYWAGSLELHSLEGYGVDAFLQISKLGNQNEQLTSRASIDAV